MESELYDMNQVKFWVAVGEEKQIAFDPNDPSRTYEVIKEVPVGEVHIIYSEVLMCRQSKERLRNELKATRKPKILTIRPKGKLCEKCEKRYKEHPDLAFAKWVNPTTRPQHKPIEINPQVIQK